MTRIERIIADETKKDQRQSALSASAFHCTSVYYELWLRTLAIAKLLTQNRCAPQQRLAHTAGRPAGYLVAYPFHKADTAPHQ
jgi:hypothetical protein